ncbi:hypothetical protein [Sphingomonas sp. OK281]|uniref:hypothetical protein n=1 Tax=Sphingomonas sp. OK281 TaxID=1881067 RepID=UPI000B877EE5|nr:hypothetical protein [Sphingomonas sp. OK281]
MTAAGLALIAAPVAAIAAPSASTSNIAVSQSVRAGTPTIKKSKAGDGGLLIIALAAVAVGGGLYLAIDDGDDSDSN